MFSAHSIATSQRNSGVTVESTVLGEALPFDTFILKIASICNLNCRYCYMYNQADKSYLRQPRFMSPETAEAAAIRIKDHCQTHKVRRVSLVLHGGEPLVVGRERMQNILEIFQRTLSPVASFGFSIQTNGVLLDEEWIDLFLRWNVSVGVSLDGPEDVNDSNRVFQSGLGSHRFVKRAIELLLASTEGRRVFKGILCVVDPRRDPLRVYQHFIDLGVRKMDFLLPDQNYDHPVPAGDLGPTPYADYLVKVFDRWFSDDDPSVNIRLFKALLRVILGGPSGMDSLGGQGLPIAVIETDGGIEPLDVLKICGDNFTKLGLNVLSEPIDALYQFQLVRLVQAGQRILCETCRRCPYVKECGGGYLPHRYSSTNGFDNPSVYCPDLFKLVHHVRQSVEAVTPPDYITSWRDYGQLV